MIEDIDLEHPVPGYYVPPVLMPVINNYSQSPRPKYKQPNSQATERTTPQNNTN
jgi:hypothetical protein